jgi:hypothetical protein
MRPSQTRCLTRDSNMRFKVETSQTWIDIRKSHRAVRQLYTISICYIVAEVMALIPTNIWSGVFNGLSHGLDSAAALGREAIIQRCWPSYPSTSFTPMGQKLEVNNHFLHRLSYCSDLRTQEHANVASQQIKVPYPRTFSHMQVECDTAWKSLHRTSAFKIQVKRQEQGYWSPCITDKVSSEHRNSVPT